MRFSLPSPNSRSRVVRPALWLALALPFAGCADMVGPMSETPENSVREAEASLRFIGRAVAMAMADSRVRLAVRDALRDSPWDAHQVVLQEYLGSQDGAGLLAAAAHAAGETPAQLRLRLASLPPLDLFVPVREQRLAWRGTSDVVVAVTTNTEGGRVFRFAPDGHSVSGARDGGVAGAAEFLITPAEGRIERSDRQPLGIGDVIQSADDGETAAAVWWVTPDGRRTRVRMDDAAEGKVSGPMANVIPGSDSTFLDAVRIYFDDGAGNVELNVDASFYGPDGSLLGTALYQDYGFTPDTTRFPHYPLFRHVIPDSGVAKVAVHVWEDDCGCWGNGDDHYGSRDFHWNDRDKVRTLVHDDGNADIELSWLPRSRSVVTTVVVPGAQMPAGQTRTVTANVMDQYGYNLSGYSVSSWSIANTYIATIGSSGGSGALVRGESVGSTTVAATIQGVTGYGAIIVSYSYVPPCCEDPGDGDPIEGPVEELVRVDPPSEH